MDQEKSGNPDSKPTFCMEIKLKKSSLFFLCAIFLNGNEFLALNSEVRPAAKICEQKVYS
jgi:hypothetical protein